MIISVASTKGGTGKTTAALQVALYLLTKEKKKVCLVDADIQGSSWLAIQSREKAGRTPALRTEVITSGDDILTSVPKLSVTRPSSTTFTPMALMRWLRALGVSTSKAI